MIPNIDDLAKDFVIVKQSSKGYKIDPSKKIILGTTDELEAVKQAIYLILNTERYRHEIYSWNYGIELEDLFGAPLAYAYVELKRRITQALLQDDRINGVDNFSFSHIKGEISVQFTVHTNYGDIGTEKVVRI